MTDRRNRRDVVYNILYKQENLKGKAINHGVQYEDKARLKFIKDHQQWIFEKSGLMINPKFAHLGASPDGIIKDIFQRDQIKAILEIKCPFNAKHFSQKNLTDELEIK